MVKNHSVCNTGSLVPLWILRDLFIIYFACIGWVSAVWKADWEKTKEKPVSSCPSGGKTGSVFIFIYFLFFFSCSVFKVCSCVVLTAMGVVECCEGEVFYLGVSGNLMEEMASRNTEMFKSLVQSFPGGPVAKSLPCSAGDMRLIPGQGGSQMPQDN